MGQFKTQKPILYSTQKKDRACRRFYGVVFSLILVFGLFNGFFVKNVLADNNYIDNILFIPRTDDNAGVLQFHVKTTFSLGSSSGYFDENRYYQFCALYPDLSAGRVYSFYKLNGNLTSLALLETLQNGSVMFPDGYFPSGGYCGSITFYAGDTYQIPLSPDYWDSGTGYGRMWGYWVGCYASQHGHYTTLTNNDYLNTIFGNTPAIDTGTYHFHELPKLTITFPHANDEIAGAFYIDGTYTIPSISDYPKLIIWFTTPDNITYPNAYKELTTITGTLHEKITNLPAGYYAIRFIFSGNLTYETLLQISIHIVNDIPPELPTGETPPIIPAFGYTSPQTYYDLHSNYSTSTALFNDLTASVGALLSNVGNSLSTFAGKFTLTDAQNTGTIFGNSISIIRSYTSNLNSFFDNFPVSQILIFYIVIFMAIIVFRLVKNLVNLIKI